MTRRTALPLGAALLAVLLAACGTSDDGEASADEPAATAEPVTVVDSRGTEVVLEDGPASRVVALEWMQAEVLLTLGVTPTGVADVEGYTTWVGAAAPLEGDVADVGTRGEPSVEAIIDLEPDLVIMEAGGSDDVIAQIERVAPVMVVQGSDATDNLGQLRGNVERIATAVGREEAGEEVLAELDATLEAAAAELEAAGVAGDGFAMADGWMDGSTVSIRMFGEGSLMSDLAEAVGLDNAWTGEVDAVWGLGQTDVEGLTALDDVHFFYSASDPASDVFAGALAENPIWRDLPFVAADQVNKLDPGTWTFGGPAAAGHFVDQIVAALAP